MIASSPKLSPRSLKIQGLLKEIKSAQSEADLEQLAAKHWRSIYQGVSSADYQEIKGRFIDLQKGKNEWGLLFKGCRLSTKDKILNVGCGYGRLEAWGLEKGHRFYGVEPDMVAAQIARRWLKIKGYSSRRIFIASGEKLPFSSDSFDLVVSLSLFEHVRQPKKILDEMRRVLKKDGRLIIVGPSYASFWETHYSLPWLPVLPKRLAKIYVSLARRRSQFLEGIYFVTPRLFEDYFRRHQLDYSNQSRELMWEMFDSQTGNIVNPRVKFIMEKIGPLVLKTLEILNAYPYIKIVVQKRGLSK